MFKKEKVKDNKCFVHTIHAECLKPVTLKKKCNENT